MKTFTFTLTDEELVALYRLVEHNTLSSDDEEKLEAVRQKILALRLREPV